MNKLNKSGKRERENLDQDRWGVELNSELETKQSRGRRWKQQHKEQR